VGGGGRGGTARSRPARRETDSWVGGFGSGPQRSGQPPARISPQAKVQPGSQVISHGWPGYPGLEPQGFPHTATPLPGDPEAAHRLFPWLYIARSHRKRFLLGTPHKVESQHLQRYLAEFNYRLKRRTLQTNRFHRLVRACLTTHLVIYKELIAVPDPA